MKTFIYITSFSSYKFQMFVTSNFRYKAMPTDSIQCHTLIQQCMLTTATATACLLLQEPALQDLYKKKSVVFRLSKTENSEQKLFRDGFRGSCFVDGYCMSPADCAMQWTRLHFVYSLSLPLSLSAPFTHPLSFSLSLFLLLILFKLIFSHLQSLKR